MADKKIIITLPRKPRKSKGGSSVRRGPIINKKKSDYLSRRRRPGGITFYDLGQFANGTSLTHHFTQDIIDGSIQPPEESQILSELVEIRDHIFETPESQMFSAFKKLNKSAAVAQSLQIGLYDADTDTVVYAAPADIDAFVGDSLTITQEQADQFDMSGDNAIFPFTLSPYADAGFKITSVRDYSASAVSFTPSVKMDIAIAPALSEMNASVNYPSGTPGTSLVDIMGGVVSTIPRNLAPVATGFAYADTYDKWRMMRGLPDIRARRNDISDVWSDISPASFAPPAYFPAPPATPDPGSTSAVGQIIDVADQSGELRMIIKQNGQFFYFWVA